MHLTDNNLATRCGEVIGGTVLEWGADPSAKLGPIWFTRSGPAPYYGPRCGPCEEEI